MEQLQIFDKDGKALHMSDVMAMLLPDINEFDYEAEQFAEGGFSTKDEKYAYTAAWQDCRTWLIAKYKSNNLEGTELDCPFSKKETEDKIKDILNEYVKKEHPSLFEIKMDYKTNNKNGIDDKLNLKDAKIIEIINIELIDHKFYI